MATTKSSTSIKRTPKAAKPVQEVQTIADPVIEQEQVQLIAETVVEKKQQIQVRELDPNEFVTVRNGFNGKLIYCSKRTQEEFVWPAFGDEQDIQLQELKNAKNTAKAFFENNWFLFDDPAVIEYLGVSRFYQNALTYDNFDDLFDMSPEEIERKVALLSDGQKLSVRYRARQLIEEGAIDSRKVITALEDSLGVELIER